MVEVIFSGYEYRDMSWYLLLDELTDGKADRKRVPIKDAPFFMHVWTQRYCTGRYDLATMKSWPCPHIALLKNHIKTTLCDDCNRFNSFNPFFYNIPLSELSEKQQKRNMSPHVVYLTYFGKDTIKVGISHQKRYRTRWLEQWARAWCVIYQCDNAYDARAIEANITNLIKIPEVMRSDKKRQLILESFDTNACINMFHSVKESITHIPQKFIPVDLPIEFLDEYHIGDHTISRTTIDLTNEWANEFSWKAIGLIGDNLLFTNEQQDFIIGIKKMISYTMTYEETIHKQIFTPKQTSLF